MIGSQPAVYRSVSLFLSVLLSSLLGHAAIKAKDPIDQGQWYVAKLDLNEVHKYANGLGVTVAVVDSGVDGSHPALEGSILPGADFSSSPDTSSGIGWIDYEGHGTGMASLIAGRHRIAGVAPAAKVLPVRIAQDANRSNFAAGIRWAVDHGADIINISGGSAIGDPREQQAVAYAIRRNVVVVAAVGNAPEVSAVQYPARYAGVLAVAASSQSGAHSETSIVGPEVDLCAPGESISSARNEGRYAVATGTSEATAIVSGVAALVRSKFPSMDAIEVVERLERTAADQGPPGRDDQFGFGLVNPMAALTSTPLTKSTSSANNRFEGTAPDITHTRSWLGIGAVVGILLLLLLAAGIVVMVTIYTHRRRR